MPERKVTVVAEVGLHARPAATFVRAAVKAPMDVSIAKPGRDPVNAKSILQILALDVQQDETVVIKAEGDGADAVLDELAKIAGSP
ncbi:HPr family phosphocarrier protein [Nonomuraea sp. 3-1Str]|uniref:HPr family phosphocarrier protein n=1 Tax=unclassified Nonomuraea TaxID=2593643 RepID=UPI00286351D6|nr:HPr family phosphocarrier protein [Nonomuraea sp. 3-1Str]MDR8414242.1 HPr family phosphocarrier protein [Nonomuraea sp. 3-1Str]